jgi:hypothetical protein
MFLLVLGFSVGALAGRIDEPDAVHGGASSLTMRRFRSAASSGVPAMAIDGRSCARRSSFVRSRTAPKSTVEWCGMTAPFGHRFPPMRAAPFRLVVGWVKGNAGSRDRRSDSAPGLDWFESRPVIECVHGAAVNRGAARLTASDWSWAVGLSIGRSLARSTKDALASRWLHWFYWKKCCAFLEEGVWISEGIRGVGRKNEGKMTLPNGPQAGASAVELGSDPPCAGFRGTGSDRRASPQALRLR